MISTSFSVIHCRFLHSGMYSSQYSSSVYIEVDQKQVNAKSIMGMMSLTLLPGEEITVVANGTDEKEAAAGIERFLVNVKNR